MRESVQTVQEAKALGMRLLQVCGGIDIEKNPKIEALVELLKILSGKIIIFHHFVPEGRLIEKRFREEKIPFVSMRGETKDKPGSLDEFMSNKKVRCLVAHPRCASEGINIQDVTNVVIWYSRDWSGISRSQGIGRIWRTGQHKPCTSLDLVLEDTVDEVVYYAIKAKQNVSQKILDWMKRGRTRDAAYI